MLRFTPYAWAKLLYFRDRSDCEVGAFAITDPDDLLLVRDLAVPKQGVSVVSVAFDDESVADHFDRQADLGRTPAEVGRVWAHCPPGDSPHPSAIDEECFARAFGHCDWAAMFILARKGQCYCRLRFNVGPGGSLEIPVEVDYSAEFAASDWPAWEQEYQANIACRKSPGTLATAAGAGDAFEHTGFADDWLEELEAMDPAERRVVLDELGGRPDLWDEGELDEWE